MDDLQKVSDEIKKQIEKLDDETLQRVYKDHSVALECAKKGIQSTQPIMKMNKRELNDLAYEIQSVALMLLKERGLK